MKMSEQFGAPSFSSASFASPEGVPAELTIQDVTQRKFADGVKPVLKFVEDKRTLVVNRTICECLIKELGDDSDRWAGVVVSLRLVDVEYMGRPVKGVRVVVVDKSNAGVQYNFGGTDGF